MPRGARPRSCPQGERRISGQAAKAGIVIILAYLHVTDNLRGISNKARELYIFAGNVCGEKYADGGTVSNRIMYNSRRRSRSGHLYENKYARYANEIS